MKPVNMEFHRCKCKGYIVLVTYRDEVIKHGIKQKGGPVLQKWVCLKCEKEFK